jgi:hypothetical protein
MGDVHAELAVGGWLKSRMAKIGDGQNRRHAPDKQAGQNKRATGEAALSLFYGDAAQAL